MMQLSSKNIRAYLAYKHQLNYDSSLTYYTEQYILYLLKLDQVYPIFFIKPYHKLQRLTSYIYENWPKKVHLNYIIMDFYNDIYHISQDSEQTVTHFNRILRVSKPEIHPKYTFDQYDFRLFMFGTPYV